ncbi:Glyoxalase/Bleomycin resistance protein/Dihydroxybiphenyl dioxygenase [Astrocystis sublimbata]|nr:Glyoxalase/Bleomycin resistance protein/Dihydroxybiphenyl dioxygenase [Astrocystis sublimbata]
MASDTQTSKVLSPRFMAHVVLQTPDKTKMAEFYKTFLGAHATHENPQMSFLTYDDEHHRIAIVGVPGLQPKDKKSAGLQHVAFTYGSLRDLLTAYTQRKAQGILPMWCVNHGPTVSLYYADPDGNNIETQVDVFDTVEEVNAFMSGPEFAKNPFGADVDPEELIRELDRGTPESELKKRKDVGARGMDSVPLHVVEVE